MKNMKKWLSYFTLSKRNNLADDNIEMTDHDLSFSVKLCDDDNDDDYVDGNMDVNIRKSKLDVIVENKKEEYVSSFTVHGLTRIFKGSKSESIFWLFMLLVGVTLSTYVIHGLVIKYYEYNIYTEVRSTVSVKNIFPAITVCEFNGMLSNFFAYCGQQRGAAFHSGDEICRAEARTGANEVRDIKPRPDEWGNGVFHVTQCYTWGGKFCANDKYLKSLKDHNHRCFTLNYNGDFYDSYSHANIEFQLNSSVVKGPPVVIAIVHDTRVTELDMTNRVVLEASNVYELKIEKTVFKRLPSPFPTNCTNEKLIDFFPGKYTRKNCMESIEYIKMLKECGDVLDYHIKYMPKKLKQEYKRNNTLREVVECIDKFTLNKDTDINNCPFPCEEIEYTTMPTFHSGRSGDKIPTYRFDIQYHRVDSYKTIEEKQLVTWDQVAGEVGGLVGLVIGASFISIIEIIFYVFLCSFHKLKRACCG